MSVKTFTLDPEKVREQIDDQTIGVVCIMGNHYGGHYDPVQEVSDVVDQVNAERGYQVGIHVDAASGGFIAPFQDDLAPWDFRVCCRYPPAGTSMANPFAARVGSSGGIAPT